MKKQLLLLLTCMLSSSSVFATSDGPDYWKVNNVASDDVLNVREKPNWKSNKTGEVSYNGICLKNLECIGGLTFKESIDLSEEEKNKIRKARPRWCKIKYRNTVGWVSGKYLRDGQDPECYK